MNTSDTSTSHATGADDPRVAGEGRSTPGPRRAAGAEVIGQFSSLSEHQAELAALREGLVLAEPPAGLAELEAALCRAVRRQRHAWEQGDNRRGWPRRHPGRRAGFENEPYRRPGDVARPRHRKLARGGTTEGAVPLLPHGAGQQAEGENVTMSP